MGILDDIQNGKPIQIEPEENPFAELIENAKESLLNSMEASQSYTQSLIEMKERNDQRMKEIEKKKNAFEARLAKMGHNSPEPPKTQENAKEGPPELRSTAPLEQLMGERLRKQEMEDGTWNISITIDLLKIDDLIKPTDFANNVAYQNHKAHVARSTPPDTYPGFRVVVQIGPVRSGKRIIRNSISKEEVMHSREFLSAFKEILDIVKANAI